MRVWQQGDMRQAIGDERELPKEKKGDAKKRRDDIFLRVSMENVQGSPLSRDSRGGPDGWRPSSFQTFPTACSASFCQGSQGLQDAVLQRATSTPVDTASCMFSLK